MIVDTPRIGDVGLIRVKGLTGWFIDLGQRLNRTEKKFARFEHSMLCVGTDWALEGQPGGAVISRVSERYNGEQIVWVRPEADLTGGQLADIYEQAQQLVGTPYSFLDYAALAAKRLGLPFNWIENYVISTKHMICSQIIVEVYRKIGIDLFPGLPSGYVTPADFAKKFSK